MIDIHCHILPMVDDGSQSVRESLRMIDVAYRDGVSEIILTPHFARPYGFDNPKKKIKSLYHDLRRIVAQERFPIDLYLGCEFLFSSVDDFHAYLDEITTLNDTRYLLYEFYFDVSGDFIKEATEEVKKAGYIPVIAHPERYDAFQIDDHLAIHLVRKGALLQMNKGSILGQHGPMARECVMRILNNHLIALVGSDAHNLTTRDPRLSLSYERVRYYFGSRYADEIFNIHPAYLIEGRDIREGGRT